MEGWVKLHRSVLDWEWFTDDPTFMLFIHLLLTVNYKDTRYKGYDIPAGSGVYGIYALSEQTGLTVSQIRTSKKKLENTGEIAIKRTNKFSIISIVNWYKYQSEDEAIANKSQSNRNQIAPSKERKKERKESTPEFDDLWQVFPKQRAGSPEKAFKAYKKIIDDGIKTHNELLEAVKNYANSDEVERGYACGGARYFNDHKFDQDCSKPAKDSDDDFWYPGAA